MPHLSKDMKRPGVNEKSSADPNHEPDFYEISKIHPLPDSIQEDESVLLQCTLQGGPKARMPIYTSAASMKKPETVLLLPFDRIDAFQEARATSESCFHRIGATGGIVSPPYLSASAAGASLPFVSSTSHGTNLFGGHKVGNLGSTLSALSAANHLSMKPAPAPLPSFASSSVAAAINASQAASQFAAGFAAATAFSQQRFRSLLDKLAQEQQGNGNSFVPSGSH